MSTLFSSVMDVNVKGDTASPVPLKVTISDRLYWFGFAALTIGLLAIVKKKKGKRRG